MKSIDEKYFEGLSGEPKKLLLKIKKTIQEAVPKAEPAMGYGVPAFRLKGEFLVYFAAFKNHVGLYPTPSAMKKFEKQLAGFETSESTIKFPLDKPVPFGLIEKIVKFKAKEILNK